MEMNSSDFIKYLLYEQKPGLGGPDVQKFHIKQKYLNTKLHIKNTYERKNRKKMCAMWL